jgi:hypothetical protein
MEGQVGIMNIMLTFFKIIIKLKILLKFIYFFKLIFYHESILRSFIFSEWKLNRDLFKIFSL